MFRTVKLNRKWYAIQIGEIDEEELDNINIFVKEGTFVILSDSIETVQEFLSDEEIEISSNEAG